MPSSIATSEKKRKFANNTKASKSFDDNKQELEGSFNDAIEDSDKESDDDDKVESIQEIANEATEQVKEELDQAIDSDDEEEDYGDDAFTTMNAIMEYNRIMVQRLERLDVKQGLNKSNVRDTAKDTLDDVSAKYNKKEESSGTHHSFELPVSDMMKGYGCFSTEPVSDDKDDTKKSEDGDDTVKEDDDDIVREKDDIVVKVEATKTGITFSIHIPRN
ncbi:hypothetical protein BDF21DRAFT_428280 [Thamnidium elegans]|uniref:Uncharacterized protein n=1 Tax=Thamnidium elegans TaxID=101142 RepID=A0A8H7SLU7_9FUNG|nr:hypothetical protein INT48_002806 [Thamnidium elegans]KAI8064128.1 hypothetical protein BDF21DRAFT_428280 [Thamnidium elegans]